MSWTKGQITDAMFEEIALAGYVFDLSPEEQQSALRRLDTQMAEWSIQGIRLGYAASSDPKEVDPQQLSSIPDWAVRAAYTNLAVSFAATKGKQLAQSTKTIAKEAFDVVMAATTTTLQKQLPRTMPRGAGHKRWRMDPFVLPPVDPLQVGGDGDLDFT